mmetsp:Transcript_10766/g.31943  ORF Transcript_10766/g.31943 Transcript_10766/m.31943 type:complete len:214 (+) Transcript_10766:1488-2129(+)
MRAPRQCRCLPVGLGTRQVPSAVCTSARCAARCSAPRSHRTRGRALARRVGGTRRVGRLVDCELEPRDRPARVFVLAPGEGNRHPVHLPRAERELTEVKRRGSQLLGAVVGDGARAVRRVARARGREEAEDEPLSLRVRDCEVPAVVFPDAPLRIRGGERHRAAHLAANGELEADECSGGHAVELHPAHAQLEAGAAEAGRMSRGPRKLHVNL